MLEGFIFKIKLLIYILIIIILILLGMVVYFKVNEFESFNAMNEQAGSTNSMANDMSDVAWSLNNIAKELNELSFETCMTRAGVRVGEQEECLKKNLLPDKPLSLQDIESSLMDVFDKDLIKIDPDQLQKMKQVELPVPF